MKFETLGWPVTVPAGGESGSLNMSTTRAPLEAGIAGIAGHHCSFLIKHQRMASLKNTLDSFGLPNTRNQRRGVSTYRTECY